MRGMEELRHVKSVTTNRTLLVCTICIAIFRSGASIGMRLIVMPLYQILKDQLRGILIACPVGVVIIRHIAQSNIPRYIVQELNLPPTAILPVVAFGAQRTELSRKIGG